ncbi:MAG: ATP-NAD kinase family protein [Lachnospiraceae bacterium]
MFIIFLEKYTEDKKGILEVKKIGFIINPIAGLGGKAGFKGSDSRENLKKALDMGYEKEAHKRAFECLGQIKNCEDYLFFTAPGELGEDVLKCLGYCYETVKIPDITRTKEDTLEAVRGFLERGADLILFCGGDGTARDICTVTGSESAVPVLGIPAGVKMYSGCFAVNPRLAGNLLRQYISGYPMSIELREVMDIDESVLGTQGNSPKLYGYLPVINEGRMLQGAKAASTAVFQETEVLAEHFIRKMETDTLYLIGPGSTTFKIKEGLGIDGTLLGVDVVKNRTLLQKDADEKMILRLLEKEKRTKIIVTCIGGSGFVFGRGNQQISARVIRMVGKENIELAITKSKLAGLWQRPLLADTGDREVDEYLKGYYRIEFHGKESAVYRMEA